MTDLPNKALLRPDEVAEYFGVSRQSVYEWLRRHKLDHVHTPGGNIRIPIESVKKLKQLVRTY